MGSLAQVALSKKKDAPESNKKDSGVSPFKDAMKEAWEASKADKFEDFAEAFEAAVEIKINS